MGRWILERICMVCRGPTHWFGPFLLRRSRMKSRLDLVSPRANASPVARPGPAGDLVSAGLSGRGVNDPSRISFTDEFDSAGLKSRIQMGNGYSLYVRFRRAISGPVIPDIVRKAVRAIASPKLHRLGLKTKIARSSRPAILLSQLHSPSGQTFLRQLRACLRLRRLRGQGPAVWLSDARQGSSVPERGRSRGI